MTANSLIPEDEITTPCDPEEILWSEYGCIPYLRWCDLESVRINRPTMPATVAYRKGLVYISRNVEGES